jgi:hypothetical protein
MNLSGSRGLEAKEPCQVWYNFGLPGPVAQLVEQRIEKAYFRFKNRVRMGPAAWLQKSV